MQRRTISLIEATISTALGFCIALTVQVTIVFPMFGLEASAPEHVGIVSIFTVVSILRGYFVRRLFNWLHLTERLR